MNQRMNDLPEGPSPRGEGRGMVARAAGVLTLFCLLLTCQAAHAYSGSLSLLTPLNVSISEVCAGQQYKVLIVIDDQPGDATAYLESSLDGSAWTTLDQWSGSTTELHASEFPIATNADNGIRYRLRASTGTILATTAPLTVHAVSLDCPMPISATADTGKCTASGISPTAPTATSDCGTATVNGSRSDTKALDDPYPVGTTTITWTAVTSGGGSASCTQTITVTTTEKLTIAAPAGVIVSTDAGQCSASSVALGTPTTGGCDVKSVTNDAPATFPPGMTTVTWTVTDTAGNQATAIQKVTVTVPPLRFATGSASSGAGAGKAHLFPTDAGKCSASLTLTPPATTGGCGTVTVTGTRSDSAALTAPYPLGQTTITWTAVDGQGTQVTTTQDITVVDQEKPVFTNCPPTGTTAIATCTTKGTGALVSFTPLAATDNCSTPTVSYDHQPGSFFAPGNTTVTATATDAAGNSAPCPFTVSVAYAWSGVLQPIDANGSSVFKAGSTVPVKFSLTGPSACVTTLAATLSYVMVSAGVAGPVNRAVSNSAATTGNLFRYTSGQYLFNWSTKGLTAGTYQLQIDLGDGATRTVTIGLR